MKATQVDWPEGHHWTLYERYATLVSQRMCQTSHGDLVLSWGHTRSCFWFIPVVPSGSSGSEFQNQTPELPELQNKPGFDQKGLLFDTFCVGSNKICGNSKALRVCLSQPQVLMPSLITAILHLSCQTQIHFRLDSPWQSFWQCHGQLCPQVWQHTPASALTIVNTQICPVKWLATGLQLPVASFVTLR